MSNTNFTATEREWPIIQARVAGICVQFFLYGILLVLSSIAAYLLYYWKGAGRRILATVVSLMALLATAQLALQVPDIVLGLQIARLGIEGEAWPAPTTLEATKVYDYIYMAEDALLVTNNIVTDGLFIYRCFVIWGRNPRVVVLPSLMLATTTVVGYLAAYEDNVGAATYIDSRLPFVTSFATNAVLLALTAGRIWWIRRNACLVLEPAHTRKYNTALAILLESGAIYCLTLLIYLISYTINNSLVTTVFSSSIPQMMNIAPMLTIVRVGLGRSVGDAATDSQPSGSKAVAASTLDIRVHTSSCVIDMSAAHDRPGEVGRRDSTEDSGKEVPGN
ncbi:hypothetical protein C8R47DRAFT_1152462 [Mycena vitilis]|nr:hypothetical protein C8R47DRAFT_1152462 [Mycena vitilis]